MIIPLIIKVIRKAKSVLGIESNHLFQKISYSQTGEDLIVEFIFQARGISHPTYIDIGAFNPEFLSNTALFYKKGCRGINVEPNPDGIKAFFKKRPTDINLNIGINDKGGQLDYYCMSIPTMNTFDENGAEYLVKNEGFTIVAKIPVSVEPLNKVISKYARNVFPDFLSLDVEGLDMLILSQIDFKKNYPKVICVETIEYKNDGTGRKNTELIRFIESKGYFVYADTYINTIFVRTDFWFNT